MKQVSKKIKFIIAILTCTTIIFAGMFVWQLLDNKRKNVTDISGNYTDEMKISYSMDLHEEGANQVERDGDHKASPYFSSVDFYNAKNTDTLTILPHFKTIQQTAWWSSGVTSSMMVLDYFGKLDDWNERSLFEKSEDHSTEHIAVCIDQIIDMFEHVGGFELKTTYDYLENLEDINASWFHECISEGTPVLIGWNEWGGHWQVVIGYDTMGTEYEGDDVIIVADPFDTSDHNQDGYTVYNVEKFICNFTFYDFFTEDHIREKCFVAVKPAK